MNRKKINKTWIMLLIIILLSNMSYALPVFNSVTFSDPLAHLDMQTITANISNADSAVIEINNQNHTMNKNLNIYSYSYTPAQIANVNFKIYARYNWSALTYLDSFNVEDLTAPSIISTLPSGVINNNTAQISISTNEKATCRFDISDINYSSMNYLFSGTDYTHTYPLTSLSDGEKTYYARCIDEHNNDNPASTIISFNVDTSPPAIILKQPSNTINSEDIELKLTTNENANCKYDIQDKTYSLMNNYFKNTGKTNHINLLTHLTQGQKSYYIACIDNANNIIYDIIDFNINLAPSADITISKSSPLKADTYRVALQTSKELANVPTLQYKYDDESAYHQISLTGIDKNWQGYIVITESTKDRIGKFYFSGKDYDGLTGNKITSGEMFITDTTKPIAPTSIGITQKNDYFEINWFYDGEDADHINIYRSMSPNAEYVDYYNKKAGPIFIDNDIDEGTTYYYRIAAVDKAGNIGLLSEEVSLKYLKIDEDDNDEQESTARRLSFELQNELNNTLREVKTLIFDIAFSLSNLEKETDRYKQKIINDLDLINKARLSDKNANNILAEIENIRNSDLSKNEFDNKIDNINSKIKSIKNDITTEISIIDTFESTQSTTDFDLKEIIDKIFLSINIESSLKQNYTKSATEIQDTKTIYQEIIVFKIERLNKDYEYYTLISKEITLSEQIFDAYIIEDLQSVINNDKSITFLSTTKTLADNIRYISYPKLQSTSYSYYINDKKQISDVKDTKTFILSDPSKFGPKKGVYGPDETGNDDNKLTGKVINDSNNSKISLKEYLFLSIGLIIITSLIVYYFFFLKEPEHINLEENNIQNIKTTKPKLRELDKDEQEYRHIQNLIDHANSLADNINFDSAKKEYLLIHEIFKDIKLDPDKKKIILQEIIKLYNKIITKSLIDKAEVLINTNQSENLGPILSKLKSIHTALTNNNIKTPLSEYIIDYYNHNFNNQNNTGVVVENE